MKKEDDRDKVAMELIGQINIVKTRENYVSYLLVNCDGGDDVNCA